MNKKIKFGIGVAVIAAVGLFGYMMVRAFTVSDDYSTTAKVAHNWRTTVDTTNHVAKLSARSCDGANWYCGTGYDDVITNGLGDGTYIIVAKTDLPFGGAAATYQWHPTYVGCVRPQCTIDGPSDGNNLVADNTVNFSSYPARDACKAVGGRLPTNNELTAIYTYRTTFGNNFQSSFYWSSTENDAGHAYYVSFSGGIMDYFGKGVAFYVRCVMGW